MASENFVGELKKIFGDSSVITEKTTLEIYSSDMCPRNLLENPRSCIAAVKLSNDKYEKQMLELISLSIKHGQKIVVRGGGSGVCGAAVPRDPLNTVIVDATGLNRIYEIDTLGGYVLTGSGIMGLRLEKAVNKYGFTLGHSPASLSISTPGGWIATRSSGQFSSRYGTIENLILGIEVIIPDGRILWIESSELKSFFRMEGTTGIITKVMMKIFPMSKFKTFYSFHFPDFKTAVGAMQVLFQKRPEFENINVYISTLRLYDFFDYKFISKPGKDHDESDFGREKSYKLEKFLAKCPGVVNFLAGLFRGMTMLIFLESDDRPMLEESKKKLKSLLVSAGGTQKRDNDARAWYKNRFKLNYEKLEKRFKEGIMVDTFDCCPGGFDSVVKIYDSVKKAVKNLALVGAHLGMDKNGPYIYFTLASAFKDKESGVRIYDEIWSKILKVCYENRGLTTHHHGVGFLKAGLGNDLVQHTYGKKWHEKVALKRKKLYDPDNLFNPGNLV